MKNMLKVVAFAALLSSVALVDAKTTPVVSVKSVVKAANKINPYFPGTWPLNEIKRDHVASLAGELGIDNPERKLPTWIFNENSGVFGNHLLADWLQLSGTVLFKWIPAVLIVRAVFRKMRKKKPTN